MPSLQTQNRLADLFKVIAEGEKQVEIIRQVLAEKSAFEPYAAFKRIDRNSNGYIGILELLDFLSENSITVLERDLISVFKEHDTHREDRISYSEFLEIVLPKTSTVLRQLATQRQTYVVEKDEVLPYEVEFALARIFEKEVDVVNKINFHRRELADRYDFDITDLFRAVDEEALRSIDYDSILNFFNRIDIPVAETEILALLRRIDKDVDGKVNYSEFHTAVSGKSTIMRSTSPSRIASPSRKIASPLRSSLISSPSRRVASPTRQISSPLRRAASPRKVASPLRTSIHSSPRRVASPVRKVASPFKQSASKLSNYDYIDYVSASGSKSGISRSPTRLAQESRVALSPVRDSLTKKIQDSQRELGISELGTSLSGSRIRSPRKVASPYRSRSPMRESSLRATSPYRSRSPMRESSLRATSPSRYAGREVLSPLKPNEEEKLAEALKEQIDLDKELEADKTELALRRDFNLLDAFRYFDIDGIGKVGKSELKDGLSELGVFATNDELYLVLRKYDKLNAGYLRFNDFSEIIAPKDPQYSEILNTREPSHEEVPLRDIFSEQTIYLFKKVLKAVIRNEVNSESTRQRLNRRPQFNLWDAFKALDKDQNGYISKFEFKNLLLDHGFFASHKDIASLIDRYDKNGDGKVSYSEFIQEITPKSPQKY